MTAINDVVDLSMDGDVAVITIDYPPVNALSPAVLEGLYDGFQAAVADPAARAIVLVCAGRTFIAGADIKTLGKAKPKVDFFECQAGIENASKPVVAGIHGTCLGGGLEVALTCHYRVGVPSAKVGLPEVNLGLLPGGGGTQRLPRVVGVPAALELMISGRHIGAKEALAAGLFDAIVPGEDLRAETIAFARQLVIDGKPAKRVRDLTDKIGASTPEDFAAARASAAKTRKGQEAPAAIIRCVEAAARGDFDAGLTVERAEFQTLLNGPQSAALRHIFMAERQAAKIADLPADAKPLPVAKVAVIGAGTMGGGIAMNFLNVGIPVTIVETSQAALDRGVATIARNYASTVAKGRLAETVAAERQALLTPTTDLATIGDADLVIEAVFEDMAIKKALFAAIDAVAKPEAILASNTSYLDIDEIATAVARPERVLGLHFFSPANVMRLLEVIRGARTAPEVLATAMAIGRRIGKIAVVSRVCPGFIGNRMLATRRAPAERMILEGVPPQEVDRVLTDFGFPMGPFAMGDMAGLDIGWSRETSTGETVRERLNEAGRHGQKAGAGFYDYDDKRRASPSPIVADIIAERSAALGIPPRSYTADAMLGALIYPMINEGAKILEEGIAQRASDIDVVWVYGYGWPAYTGGPMFYADSIGLDKVVAGLATLGTEPAPLLARLAAEGGTLEG